MFNMLTNFITTSIFVVIQVMPLMIFKLNVTSDLVPSYGTATYIRLSGYIRLQNGFLKDQNMLLIDV